MKKFIIKSFLFLILLTVVITWVTLSYKRKYDLSNEYMASIIDKHKRLEEIDSNRLLLVGGSNLAFGINSALIENELGVNTINLGLLAGLGIEFMINEAISSVKKGDILLLSIEYILYDETYSPDIDLINYTQEIYPKSLAFYHIDLLDNLFVKYKNFKKNIIRKDLITDSVYNRKAFNKYGDETGHLNKRRSSDFNGGGLMNKINIDGRLSLFKKLYLKCDSVGVKVYLLFPNYPRSEFEKNKRVIVDLKKQLASEVSYIKIINEPESFVFNDSLFYDTVYHLTGEGREKRTKLLIEILKEKVFNH